MPTLDEGRGQLHTHHIINCLVYPQFVHSSSKSDLEKRYKTNFGIDVRRIGRIDFCSSQLNIIHVSRSPGDKLASILVCSVL